MKTSLNLLHLKELVQTEVYLKKMVILAVKG